ncbi:Aspartate/methionine/tyrosine aminotransferase [Paucidesulfovibrio gracilis DSM 16080]|uniref:Aminotransferase n=1 Tax=Paucidesulfovibrio gracilis DSM 16080 TaxID=1121449 RepID=A0A1T4XFT7_9BACT|nr:pyridoxal phosphate-dependent aminotransferase [Paucidesulfovibrio gracilis]SKA88359.1 Aspartate/methionine/tyrosine aminotransferase [Paucidesulfovibrio gracilis DSM 16080]
MQDTDCPHVSSRCNEMTSFLVMDILEAAQRLERQGKNIIHMEIGEPDFDTPECVKEAACRALADNKTHYTHSLGIPELREAVCEHYLDQYGVEVHPDQIIVTQGTSPAMFVLFSSLLERGDKVVVSDPCYACYSNFIRFPGGEPLPVRVREDDAFQYRPEAIAHCLEQHPKAIMLNSPSNPTGTLLSAERMRAIAEMGRGDGPWLVSDEIYHGLVYEGREHSILEFTDKAFVFNGFSKLYAMTGWRLGYLIAPKAFIRPMQKLCQNFFISANAPAQWGGVAALREAGQDVQEMKARYDRRRKYMLQRLRGMGLRIDNEPTGAFYILVDFNHLSGDSLALAYDMLEKAHIGVTPGIDFGPGAEGYLRFSYATSLENITEGMDRLERYLAEHQK